MAIHYTNYDPDDIPAWESLRAAFCKRGVGGSSMGAVAGLDGAFNSAYTLWAEIVGLLPPKPRDNPYFKDGHDWEPIIARRFEEASGLKLRHRYAIITNDDYPHLFANVDRFVDGEDAGWEGKTRDVRSRKFDDGVPPTYVAQVTVYLAVTGKKRWYLTQWAYGQGEKHYCFDLDPNAVKPDWCEELIIIDRSAFDAAEKMAKDFVELCKSKDTPPPVDGSESTEETLRLIHPQSVDGMGADLKAFIGDLAEIERLDREIEEREKKKELHKQKLMEFLGDCERGDAPGYSVSYKTSTTKRLDSKAARAALGPALDKFLVESVSRSLRIRAVKAKNNTTPTQP